MDTSKHFENNALNKNFASRLYQEVAKKVGESGNVVISPYSMHTALAMVAMGARGETLKQLEQTLNIASIGDSEWREKMRKTHDNFQVDGSNDIVIKEIINALLISDEFTVEPTFLSEMSTIFRAGAELVDFSESEAVRSEFNKRVDRQTRGLIKEALLEGSIGSLTCMILSSVLYFKGSWSIPFPKEATCTQPFFLDQIHSVQVPMMHTREEFKVAELRDLNAKAIFLPYNEKRERHGMLLILPNDKGGLNETENRLLASGLTPGKLLKRLRNKEVILTLPKFRVSFKSEMNDILEEMGIVDLFSDRLIDLSGICPYSKLKATVLHECAIEVNECGTEAAAFSGAILDDMALSFYSRPPTVFQADHPFLFYLIDTAMLDDSMPLFAGRVNNPLL